MTPAVARKNLPEGWRLAQLAEVCSVHPGQHILETDYNSCGDGIGYLTGPADFGAKWPTVQRWTRKPKAWCEPGDVLVTVKGAGVGKANLAPSERVAIGRQLMAIRPKPGTADQFFLYCVLITKLSGFQATASGSTVPGLGRSEIESLEILFPPLAQQKRIAVILAEQLAAMERARAAAEAQLEAAKALPAAYLRAVFNSRAAQGWPLERLGELIVGARNGLYKPDHFYGSGTRILKMFNIGRLDGSWDLARVDLIRLTKEEEEAYRLDVGDILLNRVNSRELVGKCAVVNPTTAGAVYESKNIRVRLARDRANADFVATRLNSVEGRIQMESRLKQIVGQATVNRSDLNSLQIALPSLAEQDRVVAALSERLAAVNRARAATEAQLAAINALPAALLRRAFSGEL